MNGSSLVGPALIALAIFTAPVRAGEDGDVYRSLMMEKAPSVVSVKMVLRVHVEFMGQSQDQERNVEVRGVVVDPCGLIMITSHVIDPEAQGVLRQGLSVKVVPSDIKVAFEGDPMDYEAVLGFTDIDLNLSYLIIKDKEDKDLDGLAADFAPDAAAAGVQIGDELVGISRYGEGFGFAPFFGLVRVAGSVEHPRPCWALGGGFNEKGHPLFDKEGRLAGVLSIQKGTGEEEDDRHVFLLPVKTVKAGLARAKEASLKALGKEEGKDAEEGKGR